MRLLLSLLACSTLAACAHPEDRRWATVEPGPAPEHAAGFQPVVSVYSFATPGDKKPAVTVRDLSAEGQAAYINSIVASKHPEAFRKLVATPISGGDGGLDPSEAPSLDRTMVISLAKGPKSNIGDRLMRTIVTIVPHNQSFEFAGYTVAATDNEVQNIAHLETSTEASLDATIKPTVKLLGDNSLESKLGRTHTTAADIAVQYEKLNVDIIPSKLVITRESERGTDVMGNTIIKLTIVPALPAGMQADDTIFLVTADKLFDEGKAVGVQDASLDLSATQILKRCDLMADVTVNYLLRHVINGYEYYTEGKQAVQIVGGNGPWQRQLLVRADDTQQPMWQIMVGGDALIARTADHESHRLVFNNFQAAERFAAWFNQSSSDGIGKDGITFSRGPIKKGGEQAHVDRYRFDCSEVVQAPIAGLTAAPPPNHSPAAPAPGAAGSPR